MRPKRRIYYSNTVWPQYRLDNRFQWPENGTLDFHTLQDLHNVCRRKSKWLEIPYVQALFTLCSCSTSQILLAHSGPHPPNTMSPDPCSDFASSSLDHSPPPITPNPIAATPDPIPTTSNLMSPPPSILLKCSSSQPPPQPVPEASLRPQRHPLP